MEFTSLESLELFVVVVLVLAGLDVLLDGTCALIHSKCYLALYYTLLRSTTLAHTLTHPLTLGPGLLQFT